MSMSWSQNINHQITICLLGGLGLFAFVFFAPDATHHHDGSFYRVAVATSWRQPCDFAAAWCSLKIILLGAGLFLVLDALGTILARMKHKGMALAFFSAQLLSLWVFLTGNYYLVKALL